MTLFSLVTVYLIGGFGIFYVLHSTLQPWYVTMLLLHGERFYNEFIVYNNVQRATGSGVHGSNLDYLYYLRRAVDGRVYVAWSDNVGVFLARSENAGADFITEDVDGWLGRTNTG